MKMKTEGMTSRHHKISTVFLIVLASCLRWSQANIYRGGAASHGWSWNCEAGTGLCQKAPLAEGAKGLGMEACRLTCGRAGALWPIPTGSILLRNLLSPLNPENIAFTYPGQSEDIARLVAEAVKVFQWNIRSLIPKGGARWRPAHRKWRSGNDLSIIISISSPGGGGGEGGGTLLTWSTDESYSLVTEQSEGFVDAYINATTYYGARHALETLSQLAAWDTNSGDVVMAAGARILDDRPVYPHRGLLLDPARNFLPMADLYRQLDAMASCKMNVLHLHLTDSQSFPYISKRLPILSEYGALEGMNYSPTEIASLVYYAKIRGIRVLPEFDAPAHAGVGWDAASEKLGMGQLAVCVRQQPWRKLCIEPPCGQLNPVNSQLYPLLGRIYADMSEDFGTREAPSTGNLSSSLGPLIHMGGDEVHLGCWNSSVEIVDWMDSNGYPRTREGFLALWAQFQARAMGELDKVGVGRSQGGDQVAPPSATAILWTSDLTSLDVVEGYLDKSRYVIQAWMPATATLPGQLLDKGYRLIFSTKDAWYLDHGYGNWKGSSITGYPFHPWQVGYDNALPPRAGTRGKGEVLGGEAAIWGEMVDGQTLDAKTWPRAAATAERLWSDPKAPGQRAKGTWLRARPRMMSHRERMVSRGIRADALQPKWCYFNEAECS